TTGWKRGLAFSKNDALLAYGTGSGEVVLWDISLRKELRRVRVHPNTQILMLTFHSDNRRLFAGGQNGLLSVWDVTTGAKLFEQTDKRGWVGCLSLSSDGRWLAAARRDQRIDLIDLVDYHQVASLQGHEFEVFGVAFSPDDKTLASAGND